MLANVTVSQCTCLTRCLGELFARLLQKGMSTPQGSANARRRHLHKAINSGLMSSLLLAQVLFLSAMWAQNPQNASSNGLGAQASTNPDQSLLTLHAAVSEVHLVFTVTDKHGHYVRDLKQEDFDILDDRKPPEKILSFRGE